jgi:hypothetical protein
MKEASTNYNTTTQGNIDGTLHDPVQSVDREYPSPHLCRLWGAQKPVRRETEYIPESIRNIGGVRLLSRALLVKDTDTKVENIEFKLILDMGCTARIFLPLQNHPIHPPKKLELPRDAGDCVPLHAKNKRRAKPPVTLL